MDDKNNNPRFEYFPELLSGKYFRLLHKPPIPIARLSGVGHPPRCVGYCDQTVQDRPIMCIEVEYECGGRHFDWCHFLTP